MKSASRKLLFALLAMAAAQTASAQVPPHYPGSVCFTPQFWCWLPNPGPPGAACACPSPYGWVPGYRG